MAGGPLANIRVCGCISWRWKLKESEGDPVILKPAKTFTSFGLNISIAPSLGKAIACSASPR